MLFSSLLLISKICYVLKILTQFHFAEYCSGVSNLPISANLCAFSKCFLFGLFHRVQANTHEPCSWNSGQSRRKRFPTCSFMAFVRFHFKYNLKLAALQPVFTSPEPFQGHRVFSVSCFFVSLKEFFLFPPKSLCSWEPFALVNLKLLECLCLLLKWKGDLCVYLLVN